MLLKFRDKLIPVAAISVSQVHRVRPITDAELNDIGESLAKFGQIHQILVRPVKGKRTDLYELLAGRMRLEALKAEGVRLARCAVVECDDRVAEILSIVENLHRRVPSEADRRKDISRYAELISPPEAVSKRRGRPPQQLSVVAKQVAKDLQTDEKKTKEALVLERNLCPAASKALDSKLITKEQALRLSKMPIKKQVEELPSMVEESQAESRERLAKKLDPTTVAFRMLKKIASDAGKLLSAAESFFQYTKGKSLDWGKIREVDVQVLLETGNLLLDLKSLVETDKIDQ